MENQLRLRKWEEVHKKLFGRKFSDFLTAVRISNFTIKDVHARAKQNFNEIIYNDNKQNNIYSMHI